MAITVSNGYIKGDINGNFTPNFRTSSLSPVNLTGKIYYLISDERLSYYPSDAEWVEVGDADTTVVDSSLLYISSSTTIPFNDVWGKFIYLRIVGEEDGVPFTFTDSPTINRKLTQETNYSKDFTYISESNQLRWNESPLFSELLYNSYRNNLEFIDRIEYDITLIVGQDTEEYYHTHTYTKATSGQRPMFNLDSLPVGNVYIKKVVSKLYVTFQSEPLIIEQENKSAIYIRNFTVKPITFDVDIETESRGIHGSLIYGGYVFGSTRNNGNSPNFNQIVRINLSDSNDIQYLSMLNSIGVPLKPFEEIVEVGGFIYAVVTTTSVNSSIVKINPQTLDYQVFRIYYNMDYIPIIGDNDSIYICSNDANYTIYKYNVSMLNGITDKYADMPEPTTSIQVKSLIGGYEDIFVHSGITDDTYLYVSYTSGTEPPGGLYPTAKLLKSDLSFVGYGMTPKATDDMTQDDNYLYFGQEVLGDSVGKDYGTFALNKDTLEMVKLSYLSPSDSDSTSSYNSFVAVLLDRYLIQFKLNKRIYILDTTSVGDWTDDVPAKYTLGEYSYVNNGIINEAVFDYDTQTFHGFTWTSGGSGKSRYVKFQLDDLLTTTEPVINIESVETITNNTFKLNATLTSTGGSIVSEAYFEIYSVDDVFVERINITDFTPGSKTVDYTSNISRKVRFVATNSEGTAYSDFTDLTYVVTYDYIMTGKVLYGAENTPEAGVNIYLLDTSTGNIIMNTVTDINGDYSFTGLVKDKEYLLFGYKDERRIVSKVKTPLEIIT